MRNERENAIIREKSDFHQQFNRHCWRVYEDLFDCPFCKRSISAVAGR